MSSTSTRSTKKCPHKGRCLPGCVDCSGPKCKEARGEIKVKKKCPKKAKSNEGCPGQGCKGCQSCQGQKGLSRGGSSQGGLGKCGAGSQGRGLQGLNSKDGSRGKAKQGGGSKVGRKNCHCTGTGAKCSICGHEPGGGFLGCLTRLTPLLLFTTGSFLTMQLALVAAELG